MLSLSLQETNGLSRACHVLVTCRRHATCHVHGRVLVCTGGMGKGGCRVGGFFVV